MAYRTEMLTGDELTEDESIRWSRLVHWRREKRRYI